MSETILFLEEYPLFLILICLISGYLIGSVSFARLILRILTGEKEIKPFSEPVPHSAETFESDLVSATMVAKQAGPKFGCITSLGDMAKVALPSLALKLVFTSQPYYLVFALAGLIGHILPVYHSFKGGRGESPILGILLVINWSGLLLMNGISIILGFLTGSVLVVRWGAYVLMIFWLTYHFQDMRYGIFMTLVNFIYFLSMRNDLNQFNALKKKRGTDFSEEDVSEFILMGKGLGRALDKYSLYSFYKRWKTNKYREER